MKNLTKKPNKQKNKTTNKTVLKLIEICTKVMSGKILKIRDEAALFSAIL